MFQRQHFVNHPRLHRAAGHSPDDAAVLENGSWRTIGKEDGWAGDFVRTFSERANGELLVTTFGGKVLEFVGGKFITLPAPSGAPGKGYMGAVDGGGHWWVAQSHFVGWWDGKRWTRALDMRADAKDEVGCASARDGGIWICRSAELIKFRDGKEVSRRTLAMNPGGHWSMCEDSQGNVWICTFNAGVSRIAPDGKILRWNTKNGLAYDGVRFVFEDREKNLWVGTSGGGLNRFKPRRFKSYGVESVVKSIWPASGGAFGLRLMARGFFELVAKR